MIGHIDFLWATVSVVVLEPGTDWNLFCRAISAKFEEVALIEKETKPTIIPVTTELLYNYYAVPTWMI